ncbi:MAG: Cna B-type domain-containing protein [Oscillospiraceae bacterium]|nr:Cna B-type domain-containing protein [Oscillospiraceae bacterium]
MKIRQRIRIFLAVMCFFLWMMPLSVFSAGTTSITLRCFDEEQNTILSDMHWNIYLLGTLEDEKFTYSEDFVQYQDTVLLENLTASELTDFASTLKNYALKDKIEPLQTGVTDAEGYITFSGLPSGMYLLTAEKLKTDYRSWKAIPSIITVDASKSDNVVSVAKVRDATLDENQTDYTVRKVWMKNKEEAQDVKRIKDASITVEIYRNGELFETKELNEQNHWEYSWTDKTMSEWYVIEKEIPRYYTVSYRDNITEYVVVNTVQPPYRDSSFTWDDWEEETTTADESSMTDIITDTTPPDNSTTDAGSSETTRTGYQTDTVTDLSSSEIHTTTSGTVTDGGSQTTSTTKTTVTTTSKSGSGSGSGNGSGSGTGNGNGSGSGSGSGNSVQITKLPQTGQLWYPVPLLTCGGILMISIGIKLGKKDDEE